GSRAARGRAPRPSGSLRGRRGWTPGPGRSWAAACGADYPTGGQGATLDSREAGSPYCLVTAAPRPDPPPPARNLCDIFYGAVDAYAKPRHLLYKRDGVWRAVTSDEFRSAVEELSLGLRALGLQAGDRVAILAENRPEWAYADLATLAAGAEDVPVYPSLT